MAKQLDSKKVNFATADHRLLPISTTVFCLLPTMGAMFFKNLNMVFTAFMTMIITVIILT